jgi:hypothetical protein
LPNQGRDSFRSNPSRRGASGDIKALGGVRPDKQIVDPFRGITRGGFKLTLGNPATAFLASSMLGIDCDGCTGTGFFLNFYDHDALVRSGLRFATRTADEYQNGLLKLLQINDFTIDSPSFRSPSKAEAELMACP